MPQRTDDLAATMEKRLAEILGSEQSRADKARALFDLGCDRADVVDLTGMSYSQAHGIWAKRSQPEGRPEVDQPAGTSTMYTSPHQVRYATQNGHEIIRVDTQRGPECRNCGRSLEFVLKHLAFLHVGSTEEPTALEDRYAS